MARKIVLLAFENGESLWNHAKGDEHTIAVSTLIPGEQLCMEVRGLLETINLRVGLSTIQLEKGQQYRFVKKVPEGNRPSKTCVEVISNGGKTVGRAHPNTLGVEQDG